jgi:hypothetical protein
MRPRTTLADNTASAPTAGNVTRFWHFWERPTSEWVMATPWREVQPAALEPNELSHHVARDAGR